MLQVIRIVVREKGAHKCIFFLSIRKTLILMLQPNDKVIHSPAAWYSPKVLSSQHAVNQQHVNEWEVEIEVDMVRNGRGGVMLADELCMI